MVPRETVSFVFPRVLMFPETKSRETSGLEGKQNFAFVVFLTPFHLFKSCRHCLVVFTGCFTGADDS